MIMPLVKLRDFAVHKCGDNDRALSGQSRSEETVELSKCRIYVIFARYDVKIINYICLFLCLVV